MGHYYPHTVTRDYVVFASRWQEAVLYRRASPAKHACYFQGDAADEMLALIARAGRPEKAICMLIPYGPEACEQPPSIAAWFAANPHEDAVQTHKAA